MQGPKIKTMQLQLLAFQSESAFQQCRYMMFLPLLWNINVGLSGSVSFKCSRVLCLHWELSQKLLLFIIPHINIWSYSRSRNLLWKIHFFFFPQSHFSGNSFLESQTVDAVWLTVELLKYLLCYNEYFSLWLYCYLEMCVWSRLSELKSKSSWRNISLNAYVLFLIICIIIFFADMCKSGADVAVCLYRYRLMETNSA